MCKVPSEESCLFLVDDPNIYRVYVSLLLFWLPIALEIMTKQLSVRSCKRVSGNNSSKISPLLASWLGVSNNGDRGKR